jgi:hypothetical protein
MPSIPSIKLKRFSVHTIARTASTWPAQPNCTRCAPTRTGNRPPSHTTAQTAAATWTAKRMPGGTLKRSSRNPAIATAMPPPEADDQRAAPETARGLVEWRPRRPTSFRARSGSPGSAGLVRGAFDVASAGMKLVTSATGVPKALSAWFGPQPRDRSREQLRQEWPS